MFLGRLDPDVRLRIRCLLSSSKNIKKPLIPTALRLYDFLSFENDVNVPSKRNKQFPFTDENEVLTWKKHIFRIFYINITKELFF
jgi:hypothetical protein